MTFLWSLYLLTEPGLPETRRGLGRKCNSELSLWALPCWGPACGRSWDKGGQDVGKTLLGRSSALRHWYLWEVSLKLAWSVTWPGSRDAEGAKHSSVFGAEWSSPLWVLPAFWIAAAGGNKDTQSNAENQSVERLFCKWSSMLNVGARFYCCNLFHLGLGRWLLRLYWELFSKGCCLVLPVSISS